MQAPAPPTHRYDAFISYSRKDIAFARRLHQALRAYRPPKGLPVPQRNLQVFRDETDFVGHEYHASLERNLAAAATLVVICSPNAAASPYVADEIVRFAEVRGAQFVVTVLLDGIPNNEARQESDPKAFPEELIRRIAIPLAADYRGFDPKSDRIDKGRFEPAWFKMLADVYTPYGVDRNQIEQREQRRRAERLRNVAAVSGGVAVALIGLTIWALISRHEATLQRDLATAGQREAEARLAFDTSGDGLIKATLLSAASLRATQTPEGQVSMTRFLGLLPRAPIWQHGVAQGNDPGGERHRVLAFSPDGRRVASADAMRKSIELLDATTGSEVGAMPLTGLEGADRTALAYSPDGSLLVAGCGPRACVFDVAAGRLLTTLPRDARQGSMVWTASFSPDGRTLLTGSYHSEDVFVYDVSTWRTVAKIPHGVSGGFSVAVSRDGAWLATASNDAIRLWRLGQYQSPVAQVPASGTIWSIAFDPDSDALVTAGRYLERWRITSERDGSHRLEPRARASLQAHTVIPVTWHNDTCVAASTAFAVHLLCGDDFIEVLRVPVASAAAAVSPDGRQVVNAQSNGTLAAYGLDNGIETRRVAIGTSVRFIANAPNHPWLAAAADDAVVILDTQTWSERARFRMPTAIDRIAASPDGRWLAASAGRTVRLFDSSTWQPVAEKQYAGPVTWIAFAPQQTFLVVVSDTEVAGLYPEGWDERFRFPATGEIQQVAIDRTGTKLAIVTHWSGGHDSGVQLTRVWDVASRQSLGWQYTSGGGSFTRQRMEELIGEQHTSASGGDTALVGEASSWPSLKLREPDELASADGTWKVRVFANRLTLSNVAVNRIIGEWEQGSDVTGVAFVPVSSPRWLVSGGADGNLRVWPLTAADLVAEACSRLRASVGVEAWTKVAQSSAIDSCGPH